MFFSFCLSVFLLISPALLSNFGPDLSINNIVWLGLVETKIDSQGAKTRGKEKIQV